MADNTSCALSEIHRRIREAAARGALAHALLFTGEGDGMAAALCAAAAFQCTAERGRPCGVCAACRKVFAGIHPDVITVRDDEHKQVSVDMVRAVRQDVYIRPNEGARKVYLFPDCALLSERDQNVLLKIVEEGPPYAAFCFCAENRSAVLQTLRSRCVELPLQSREETAPLSERAQALCAAMTAKKIPAMVETLCALEQKKLTREELEALLGEVGGVLTAALALCCGADVPDALAQSARALAKNLTKQQIMGTIELLQTYRRQCRFNVNPGQMLGALAAEWEGIL